MKTSEFTAAKRKSNWKPTFAALLACLTLSAAAQSAVAIVLIDDFNSPAVANFINGQSASGINGNSTASLSYDPNGFGSLGSGTIGSERILATRGHGSTSANVNAATGEDTGDGALSFSLASSGLNQQNSRALVAWNGGNAGGIGTGDFDGVTAATFGASFFTNPLNPTGGLTYDANGIWLSGIQSALGANSMLQLGVFRTASDYAYFQIGGTQLNALTGSDYFIPWGAGTYTGTGTSPAGFRLANTATTTLDNIFTNVTAIVLQVRNTAASGGGGTFSIDSIYAFTPEPASLVMWSLFSVVGVAVGCRRRKATGALPNMESAAALA